MKTQDHIHKLKRHKYPNGTQVYFCVLNCSFKVDVPFALGKEVLCHICDKPFIMNEYSIKLIRPHCTGCGKMKVKDDDGNTRYVNKARPIAAIAEMGKAAVGDLRQRLGTITMIEKDEDI